MKSNNIYLFFILSIVNITYSIPVYFCTAANDRYFPHLLNLIGSIHATNFGSLAEIAIFNLGMPAQQIDFLKKIEKVCIYEVEKTHPDILKYFNIGGRVVPGWYAWKPVCIKQSLDRFPYVLWIDAGSTILKSLDHLFSHIQDQGYFVCTIDERAPDGKIINDLRSCSTKHVVKKFDLDIPENRWILDHEQIMAGVIGCAKDSDFYKKILLQLFNLSYDLKNFEDDGSTPNGFGTARYEQTLLGALSLLNNFDVFTQDSTQQNPILLANQSELHITWNPRFVCDRTHIFSSRRYVLHFAQFIRYR